ncbi:dTDP-4-dehydrorhamnose 3,5-epimerase [soil metagenome]
MEIRPLRLDGTFEITLKPNGDARGYFMRSYDRLIFENAGLQTDWVQENQSLSRAPHTIRGLHYQRPPHAETKLVRVVCGAVLDVFVDLRRDSATYGQWDSVELAADRHNMAYIPRGFAHGFCTLTEEAVVQYKVDNAYAPDHENGILWNDPTIAINWPSSEPVISDRDGKLQFFDDLISPF